MEEEDLLWDTSIEDDLLMAGTTEKERDKASLKYTQADDNSSVPSFYVLSQGHNDPVITRYTLSAS